MKGNIKKDMHSYPEGQEQMKIVAANLWLLAPKHELGGPGYLSAWGEANYELVRAEVMKD